MAAASATTVLPAAAVGHAVTSAASPSPAAPAAAAVSVADAPTFAKTEPDQEVATLDDDAEDEDPGEIIVLEECELFFCNLRVFAMVTYSYCRPISSSLAFIYVKLFFNTAQEK